MFMKGHQSTLGVFYRKYKKQFWVVVIFVLVVVVIKPFRTDGIIKNIAESEFQVIPLADSLRIQLTGPVIHDKGIYASHAWFKVLEWGDTAMLHIDVYKRPQSFSWRDKFFWPRITMNYKWYYFVLQGDSLKLKGLLPDKGLRIPLEAFQLDVIQFNRFHNSQKITFLVPPEMLLILLKKGYFTVVEKKQNHTIVEFYGPIANVRKNGLSPKTWVSSAKVSINDSLQIFVDPTFESN